MIDKDDDEDLILSNIRFMKIQGYSIDLVVEELLLVGIDSSVAREIAERAYFPVN